MPGWSIAQAAQNEQSCRLTLFCNQHTRLPEGHAWRRLDMQDERTVQALMEREPPGLIIHCAGICDVDKCEASPDFAHEVNVASTELLLEHVPDDTRIVYISSDHVFSGDTGPYFESSPRDPISVYGRTRARAEEIVLARHERALVVRSGLWIGPSHNGRIGHLDWLRYRCAQKLPMTVVAGEYRSAVWARDAARRVLALAASDLCGVRHVAASEIVSRPGLAGYLDRRFAIGARFTVVERSELAGPHLGRIDLRSEFADELAQPLPPVAATHPRTTAA